MYARAWRQRLGEFPGVRLLWFCPILACRSPPNTPRASDTVATSGFTRLPLYFTRVPWTVKFGARELAIVPNQLAKRCSPYRLFVVLSKGLNFFVFYSLLVKYR